MKIVFLKISPNEKKDLICHTVKTYNGSASSKPSQGYQSLAYLIDC
jgi:hypothetical protein